MKGPDMMSKSKRTQRRHCNANHNQASLDGFRFSISHTPRAHMPKGSPDSVMDREMSTDIGIDVVEMVNSAATFEGMFEVEPVPRIHKENNNVGVRGQENESCGPSNVKAVQTAIGKESVEVEIPTRIHEETVEVEIPPQIREESIEMMIPSDGEDENSEGHGWEDDLDECIWAGIKIRSWEDLQKQIKEDLQKGSKTLPLSQLNQLLILRNFATLRLKRFSKTEASLQIATQWHEGEGKYYARKVQALARHYQIFEQLPREKHGGEKMC